MDWALWRSWTRTVTVGEVVGFLAPALVAVLLTAADAAAWVLYLAMLPAGAIEGACLGFAQAWALRRHLPHLSRTAFTGATALAATLAYAIGMLPSTVGEALTDLPMPVLIIVAGVAGVVLLLSIGTAQALVLRRIGLGSWWWIAATAGAWLAALMVFLLVTSPLWRPGQPLWLAIAIGVGAGALMAATAAALTGFAAVRLVRSAALPPPGDER